MVVVLKVFCWDIGGSIFLFDRKAVRFFRKDGHNWRKKADGKTVRETHEKLKVYPVVRNCRCRVSLVMTPFREGL